jgi:hypothetical protein
LSLPTPEPGLVISYAYLWRHEHNRGQDEGRKVRPSVIVLNATSAKDGSIRVTVAAITHTPPAKGTVAIEIPPKVKAHLKLDHERSWVILDEVNQFVWPGYDLRLVPGAKNKFAYGFIPPRLYAAIVKALLDANSKGAVKVIPRD